MKDYADFINDWTGKRMTLEDFCQEHAQWERDNLGIEPDDEPDEWPVLDNENGTMALVHINGVLFVYPQVEGHWEHDPDPEVLFDTFPELTDLPWSKTY